MSFTDSSCAYTRCGLPTGAGGLGCSKLSFDPSLSVEGGVSDDWVQTEVLSELLATCLPVVCSLLT